MRALGLIAVLPDKEEAELRGELPERPPDALQEQSRVLRVQRWRPVPSGRNVILVIGQRREEVGPFQVLAGFHQELARPLTALVDPAGDTLTAPDGQIGHDYGAGTLHLRRFPKRPCLSEQ